MGIGNLYANLNSAAQSYLHGIVTNVALLRRSDSSAFFASPQVLVRHPRFNVRLELVPQILYVEDLLADDRGPRVYRISAVPAKTI